MTEAMKELGSCQVRSETDRPCSRAAVVEIWGVPFCERCAREQKEYFAIGELTQEEARGLRGELLAKALGRMRWKRVDYTTVGEAGKAKVAVGAPE